MKFIYFSLIAMMAFKCDTGIIGETGFENWPAGHMYTMHSLKEDGFIPAYVDGFDQERCVVDDKHARSGSKSLKVTYPKGGVGPSETGASAPLRFDGKDEVYISYWLRFSENFDWGRENQGGKLPGLASGDNCSGGDVCDGTNGFTARMMWRDGGSAVLYLYHMDKPGKYGEDIPLTYDKGDQVVFEKGFNGAAPVSSFIDITSLKNPDNITFHLNVNNEERQRGVSSDMLFSFDQIISYISRFIMLKKGDFIFTGTPEGVGPITIGDQLTGYIENNKMLDFEIK